MSLHSRAGNILSILLTSAPRQNSNTPSLSQILSHALFCFHGTEMDQASWKSAVELLLFVALFRGSSSENGKIDYFNFLSIV